MSPPTVADNHIAGTRQLAVLATVSAVAALGLLLLGAAVAGLTADADGTVAVLAATALIAFGLAWGWVPGLYLGLAGIVTAAVLIGPLDTAASPSRRWGPTIVLAVTLLVVHEAARFSFDARSPTRLGRSILRRFVTSVLAVGVLTVVAGLLVRRLTEVGSGALWLPAGFAAAAGPFMASRLVGVPGGRAGRHLRVLLSAAAAILIVAVAAVGASHREQQRAAATEAVSPDGRSSEPPPPPARSDETTAPAAMQDAVAMLIGMLGAAAVLGLLYGAFHRRQLLLVQDDLDLDLDDSIFLSSLPDGAELDEVELDADATIEMLRDVLGDLDAEPDPGRAIRLAYARVESELGSVGLVHRPDETVGEYFQRCLPRLADGAALGELTALFERARFSEAAVPESARARARRDVTAIEAQLGALEATS